MIQIKNGRVITPDKETGNILEGEMELYIAQPGEPQAGRIVAINPTERPPYPITREIDATGLLIFPGLVDVHVHFRDPGFTYKEDIETGARAAARGGVTTVVLMANTKPTVDNEETLDYVLQKGRTTDIHVETCVNVTKGMKGQELVDVERLLAKGAVGITDDGVPILDAELARRAMELSAKYHIPISFHEEDPAYIENNGINHGKASEHFGIGGSDRQAEISMVKRDLEIALETGAMMDVQHISSKEAVELVRQAKKRPGGENIHAEATPHHFTLTEDAAIAHGTMAKMNPPLREEADRQAIIEGIADGTIDLIATDHAPHSIEEKEKPLTQAPSGILGLETSLALANEVLVQSGRISYGKLTQVMAYNPAKLYHLDAGYIAQGGPGDLVLFAPKRQWKVEGFASKSSNSPFLGRTMTGQVMMTICNGKIIYESGE